MRPAALPVAAEVANSPIGTFSDALTAEAKTRGWTVISMKHDWRRTFAFEKLSQ